MYAGLNGHNIMVLINLPLSSCAEQSLVHACVHTYAFPRLTLEFYTMTEVKAAELRP